jgi:hypothetical protein
MTQEDYTPDFRALCAELLEALENAIRVIYNEDGTKHISTADPVIAKADAALSQPEPVERPIWTEGICGDGAAILKDGVMQPIESVIAALNAAELAQPEPQGPTEDEWDALKDRLWDQYETIGHQGERFIYDGDFGTALDVARQELSRWGK